MKVLVLLSGGIDSTCCVHFYKQAGHEVSCVFVDYGQAVREQEERSAVQISRHYSAPLHIVRTSGPPRTFQGEIIGRNALLLFACLLYLEQPKGVIAFGIHAGTNYYDCSEHFIEHSNAIVSGYSNGTLAVAAPFLGWSKSGVYDYCVANHIPTNLTWSCEVGPNNLCGRCLSCEDRAHLNVCTTK